MAFKPTDLRRQYGFTVGGPILRDKLFFFLAGDRFFHDFPAAATILGTSANANFYNTTGSYAASQISQLASLTGMSPSAAASYYTAGVNSMTSMLGEVPRTGGQTIFFPKIDWQLNQKNRVSVEANRMRWTSPAGIQTSPAVAYGIASFGNDYVRDNWIVGKLDSFITTNFSNEVRYMYGRDFEFEFNQQPTSYEENNLVKTSTGYTNSLGLPPNVYLSGFFQFGTPQFLNRAALPDERRWQIADTVEWIRGNHDFKFGGDYIHTNDLISNLYNQYGGFTYSGNTPLGNYFADLYLSQNPGAGTADNYTYFNQGAGLAGIDFNTGDYSLFAQDEWKVNPRLSVTLGLRWEYEHLPSTQLANSLVPATSNMPSNLGNVGPRVGFAYDVYGHGTTVVRGGYGFFFARAINATIYQNLIVTGASGSQTNPQFNPGAPCAPQLPAGRTARRLLQLSRRLERQCHRLFLRQELPHSRNPAGGPDPPAATREERCLFHLLAGIVGTKAAGFRRHQSSRPDPGELHRRRSQRPRTAAQRIYLHHGYLPRQPPQSELQLHHRYLQRSDVEL